MPRKVYIIAPQGYYAEMKSLRQRIEQSGYEVMNQALELPELSIELCDRIVLHPGWMATKDSRYFAEYAASIGKPFLSRKLT